jgi:RNA polymerase sigma-70 factor, ECF subfamily
MDAALSAAAPAPALARGDAGPTDRGATFTALIDRQLDGAYRLAAVILGDALEAEDAVHDAAVHAWSRFVSLRDPDRFDAWFGRILVNECRDRLRRRKRVAIVDLGALGRLVEERSRAADPATGSEERDEVSRALARLEPEHQVVLVLRYWLDLPVDAIAERLGIPAGTVKSRLHNAGRRLRQVLEDGARR